MLFGIVFAAVTVSTTTAVECPDEKAIAERLAAVGASGRAKDDIRVRFSAGGGRLVSEIEVSGAETRRIEHEGSDCASLADATVALLSVLLDDGEHAQAPPREALSPERPLPQPREPSHFRAESGVVVSSGIVAASAAGATVGFAWRPSRWASIGLVAEMWPQRDHALQEGRVTVAASSLAAVACAGHRWKRVTLEGCALGHGGFYSLSAEGFRVVRSERRELFGLEGDVRAAFALGAHLGIFVRAGLWLPFGQLDVTARGANSGFVTTSFGPKGALGLELNL